jgi:MoxR-like ATPase
MLLRSSRAYAAAEGRDYVIPDDVKTLAIPVMSHRVLLTADAAMNGRTSGAVLADLLEEVPVPIRGRA